MKYITETHQVDKAGYVRGTVEVTVYFDPITKKRVDFDTTGKMEIIRDDTEIDIYDLPDTARETAKETK